LPELVWPNCTGTSFAIHRRWSLAIPGGDGLWTPSLYMGLLPLGFAFAAWRVRRGPARVRWLSWTALLFAIASLGWYGLGWIVYELLNALGAGGEGGIGSPVGGLYWLMVVLLPSYAYFRYPAKLLVFAALAMSLLAARGFDRQFTRARLRARGGFRLPHVLLSLAAISLLLATAAVLFHDRLAAWFALAPPDAVFGPIDAPGAIDVLIAALLQTAAVAAVADLVLRLARKKHSPAWQYALLTLTAFDLAAAHGWMIASAPRSLWSQPTAIGEALQADAAQASYRVYRALPYGWLPSTIGGTSSSGRFREALAWDRGVLMPKYHLRGGHRLTFSPGTIESHDYRVLLNVAGEYGVVSRGERSQPHPAVLRALSTRYLIAVKAYNYPGAAAPELPEEQLREIPAEVKLQRLPDAFPRAWIVHNVERLEPLTTNEPAVVGRRTRDVLFPELTVRDLRRSAVVEWSRTRMKFPPLSGKRDTVIEELPDCRIVVDEPQRVEVEVELERRGLLLLNDLYYPGWECSHGEILRTNRTMRGVLLSPGRHRVVFTYRPRSFYWGASISGLAWLVLASIVAGVWTYRVVGRNSRR
jgi:hypothetical protein